MPDQDTKPNPLQESNNGEQAPKVTNFFIWLVPLVIVIVLAVIAVLAFLGPSMGTVYTSIGGTL